MSIRLGGRPLPIVGCARIYVCGITPYDITHLGHAATFVWVDTLARLLHHTGLNVEVCRNITDVDDDMLDKARERGVHWRSLATQQTYRFEDDMRRLGVAAPTYEPASHNYIDEVIALAAGLLESDAAYEREGTVYFREAQAHKRFGINREGALVLARQRGGRPDDSSKDDPLDVPVWQLSAQDEPSWPSPWGDGRPGWHAECTAMALANLGSGIDIHGGGKDLAFPHHAYEAAQAEALTGVAPFARSWMHVGTVHLNGSKMAKSTGNLVFVHELLEEWPAAVLRLLILDRPWGSEWEYRREDVAAAAARVDRIQVAAGRPGGSEISERASVEALLDDLDVSRALSIAEEAGGSTLRSIASLLGVL